MACFLVPAAEAVITTIAVKAAESGEKKAADTSVRLKLPFSAKIKWLNHLLWGGSALLAFEHIWHGEVVPYFPFLTAASNPADAAEMLGEMSTAGIAMAVLVTAFWAGMVAVSGIIEKRALKEASAVSTSDQGGIS